jgi:ketosteroid isomerase-like protein
MKPELTQEVKTLNQTIDIALSTAKWHLTGTGPDSNPMDMRGHSVAVLRHHFDGTWCFVIDNPFGLGWEG